MTETQAADAGSGTRFEIADLSDGSELRLPERYWEAIEFLAHSWWRRTLIKLISGGRIEFHD